MTKSDGSPYQVFTPFYKQGCLSAETPRKPLSPPSKVDYFQKDKQAGKVPETLLPDKEFREYLKEAVEEWDIGEEAAWKKAKEFAKNTLANYVSERNYPARKGCSRMSPPLHFGEISPN